MAVDDNDLRRAVAISVAREFALTCHRIKIEVDLSAADPWQRAINAAVTLREQTNPRDIFMPEFAAARDDIEIAYPDERRAIHRAIYELALDIFSEASARRHQSMNGARSPQ